MNNMQSSCLMIQNYTPVADICQRQFCIFHPWICLFGVLPIFWSHSFAIWVNFTNIHFPAPSLPPVFPLIFIHLCNSFMNYPKNAVFAVSEGLPSLTGYNIRKLVFSLNSTVFSCIFCCRMHFILSLNVYSYSYAKRSTPGGVLLW